MVPKTNCILHRRALCGDVVSFKNKFQLRNVTLDQLVQHVSHRDPTEYTDGSDLREGRSAVKSREYGTQANLIVFRIRDDLSWKDVALGSSLTDPHVLRGLSSSLFFMSCF